MKTASCAMQDHLRLENTTLAYLWKVKRADGTILGFTTHDLDIVYDCGDGDGAVTYLAASGFTNTATAGKSDLAVDNMEVTGFLESPSITEADLRGGFYDNAVISIRVVNWADLTMGDFLIRQGTLGIVKMKNGMFTAEIRGVSHKLTANIGETYGPVCRATFGSGLNGIGLTDTYLCKVDVMTWRQSGSVSSATDARTIVPTAGLLMVGSGTPTVPAPAGWFDDGIITFTSGALNGQSFEIKVWDGTTLELFLAMPAPPAPADTFTIEPGCDKTNSATTGCRKYNNIVNRRAEDFIPGMDQILNYPNNG